MVQPDGEQNRCAGRTQPHNEHGCEHDMKVER